MAETDDTLDIAFTLDGAARACTIGKRDTALPLLRGQLGCSRLKAGCSPQGVCGSCAALVDGKPRLTCTLPAKALDGKDVVTVAGLGARGETIGRAFAAAGLAQSGYAVPGMVIACAAAIDKAGDAALSADDARKALMLHVSRELCTDAVVDAFLLADRALRDGADPAALLGLPADAAEVHPDRVAAAVGRRPSLDDLQRPGMLHAAVVFAPHARCRIDAVHVDDARAMAGVRAVLTAAELPAARGAGAATHGVCVADWPVLVGAGATTRGCADLVAVVAADSLEAARAAAAAVRVDAQRFDPETDAHHAAGDPERLIHRVTVERGEPRAALGAAAFKARAQLSTAGSDPAFVEPEAALAVPLHAEEGQPPRFRVYSGGQDLFRDLEQLCGVAGLDPDQLEVEHLPVGGSFGSRLDLGVAPHALLLAQATGRPVKLALEMAEGSRLHAGRHPTWSSVQLGCDADGQLVALRGRVILDTGGHAGAGPLVADTIARHAAAAYEIPHVELDVLCVRSDNPVSGASPGLGVPEWTFALETTLDRLAATAGLDPLELRRRNLLAPGDHTAGAEVAVPSTWNPGPLLQRLSTEVTRLRDAGGSVGIALGTHVQGLPADVAAAALTVIGPGHVRIDVPFSEHGQGFAHRAIQAAAAHTGLPAAVFALRTSTASDLPSGPTLSGRDRRLGVPAVAAAADRLAAALADAGGLAPLIGQRFEAEHEAGPAIGLCAAAAAVGPDGKLAEVVVVSDVGVEPPDRACIGWLGGVAELGAELAVTAEREVDADAMPETRWTKLGVLKARHAPPVTVHAVAGGAAVPLDDAVVAAVPAAIAAAVAAASGTPVEHLPMTDATVARGMGVRPKQR